MKCLILGVDVVFNHIDLTSRVVASVYATDGEKDHFFEVGLLKLTEELLWNIPNIGYIPKEAEVENVRRHILYLNKKFGITQYKTVIIPDELFEMCNTEYEKYTTHISNNVKAHTLTRACTRTLNAFRRECFGVSKLVVPQFGHEDKKAVLKAAARGYDGDDYKTVYKKIREVMRNMDDDE